jgi:SAM-dependent methyltransferase
MSAAGRIQPAAARGFQGSASAYERGRPGYPDAAVGFLVERLGIGPSETVLDLAAGTGKLTRCIEPTGASIVAVEPVAAMRDVLAASLPGVRVLDGIAEAIPLPAGSVDAVVAAQAFHWFDGPIAVREIGRVLRPGGGLAIVFNVRDDRAAIQRALEQIWERYREGTPTHRGGAWRVAFERQDAFGPIEDRAFPHTQSVTAEELVDRVVSVSFIATLSREERAAVAGRVRELAPVGGTVELPYRTEVFITDRR